MDDLIQQALYFSTNEGFDSLYPDRFRRLSKRHWTPLGVARKAAHFLASAPAGNKILDIGSGVGKFCLVGGHYFRDRHFYGVEQRPELVRQADAVKQFTGRDNVTFIHANVTDLDLEAYDHFYFYNAFFENLVEESDRIDNRLDYSEGLYNQYAAYVYRALEAKPPGTRLVTFHSLLDEIPPGYRMVYNTMSLLLRCWIKE